MSYKLTRENKLKIPLHDFIQTHLTVICVMHCEEKSTSKDVKLFCCTVNFDHFLRPSIWHTNDLTCISRTMRVQTINLA